MGELTEKKIEAVEEGGSTNHSHDLVSSQDGTLSEHLHRVHGLDAPTTLSHTTLEGLHDRLHGEANSTEA
ncbi:MAG: hypothetical protein KY438_10525 [Actinobacteria bacterium]|nr:hypothetical protein [Actinomycetota bacterium]